MESSRNILLVEDDAITLMVCERIIKITGFTQQVVSKNNGAEAIEYVKTLLQQEEPLPNIIFLDINMPVMNGWDFLNEFKQIRIEREFQLPDIYILSSTVDPEDHKRAEQFNCVKGFLTKPLTKEHLAALQT